MPTIGSYTSIPSDRFRVMRSYLTWFKLKQNSDNHPVTWNGAQFVWPSAAFPSIVQYATILPEFMLYSRNAYTLDYIVTEYYYTVSPSPTKIPNAGLIMRYTWDQGKEAMIIELEKESADREQYFALVGGAGGYWLDPVPS